MDNLKEILKKIKNIVKEVYVLLTTKYKKLTINLAVIIICLGFINIAISFYDNYRRSSDPVLSDYETLDYEHVFEKITYEEFEDLQTTSDDFIVYLGSAACSTCSSTINAINSLYLESGIEQVYYVDFDYKSDLSFEFKEEEKFDYVGTPAYLYFVDGEFLFSNQTSEYRIGNTVIESVELATNDYLATIK